jgi:basic amino acid/polyamine antiporter, APA family
VVDRRADPGDDAVSEAREPSSLARVVGIPGAVGMGLGSILGTGIFVSVGIAAGVAGPHVIFAVALAALVATFNGLSSAELAASHPTSGGTYEYGARYLNPTMGFVAGWTFLAAKSASAATAALGLAGYALHLVGIADAPSRVALAFAAVVGVTVLVGSGLRRSNLANAVIVSVTLLSLLAFSLALFPAARGGVAGSFAGATLDLKGLLHGTALMFVAYTGYGRVATLGEEIRDPAKNIPRAVILTLAVSFLVYVAVTFSAVFSVGPARLAEATRDAAAPLEAIAREVVGPEVARLVAVGAVTAMLGVLLNLLLGLSRVLLAMSRRGDMPRALAKLDGEEVSPRRAVYAMGAVVALLTLVGSVEATWSFSAFTVLVYYAITNLAALRLPREHRRHARIIPALGLASCAGLAFWVDPLVWAGGLALIGVGLLGRFAARSRA